MEASFNETNIKPHGTHVRETNVFRSALFGILYTLATALTSVGAYYALSGSEGQASDVIPILQLNLVLVAGLAIFLILRLYNVLYSPDTGRNAPRLHRRFVLIFSLAAIVPALLVGVFFSALMSKNLNDIFGSTVRKTMETTAQVSTAYLSDKRYEIGQGIIDMATDLNRAHEQLVHRINYTDYLINQAVFREFPVVYVIDGSGRILAQAEGPQPPEFVLPSRQDFDLANNGTITFIPRTEIDFLAALFKLDEYPDAYVYTGRYLRAGLLSSINDIEEVESLLTAYSGNSKSLNFLFLLTYIEMACLILIAAIWLGLLLANRIVSPLGQMVGAAEKVRSGDLMTRINAVGVWDEIGDLANAFNRMTRQLFTQREDLIREHSISEQRREFSEAVLSGVSAGVVGLSPEGRVTLINRSAEQLLGIKDNIIGEPLASVLAGFEPAFKAAQDDIENRADDQINLETPHGVRNLDIRISAYKGERQHTGWVVTFDDMTRLVSAQRHSAWREVARRIAHEIKNPLTPILLSAERLERKYANEIVSDPEVFKNCTHTIIKQVSSLGRMVDEFSAFARMPAPVLESIVVEKFMQDTQFAQRVAFPEVKFYYENKSDPESEILCDERLISQALVNIYKNANEAISRRIDTQGIDDPDGAIRTRISSADGYIRIEISDNGLGWPQTDTERFLEPYMTTRDEGTGLGLAIVKRIIEDHGGDITLSNSPQSEWGAVIVIHLPMTDAFDGDGIPPAHQLTTNKEHV
jgi:two-component system nitrogen regulation sensor histidine kinase NtrY